MDPRAANRMLAGAAVAVLIALASCQFQITGYPPQPEMTLGPRVTDGSVHLHWMSGVDEVAKHCLADDKIDYGCAKWAIYGEASVCDLYAVKPRDFNDEAKLAMLGHELFHCMGARH